MKKLWISHDDRKLSREELRVIYEPLIPIVRKIARKSGYAIGVHGSLTRDCDLMAMPWTDKAVLPITLAHRISKGLVKYPKSISRLRKEGKGNKPWGRECYVIYLGHHVDVRKRISHAIYIDLSVMPRK